MRSSRVLPGALGGLFGVHRVPTPRNSGPKHNLDSCTSQRPIPAPVRSAFNGAEGPGLAQKDRDQGTEEEMM
ncbi:hypothetical protein QQF64_032449 [Cirrhinus molitorella]|uniref:Uncharacterized protein n=1 Tax=Cirrhinus molitorella TaxID=172907 RepID=A0ABR3N005_9TELE